MSSDTASTAPEQARKNIRVTTAGRSDLDEFFKSGPLSGLRYGSKMKLVHSPMLLFVTTANGVLVVIVEKVADVLHGTYASLPDDTRVMMQWPGKWRSDFFQFSLGELRTAYNRDDGEQEPI